MCIRDRCYIAPQLEEFESTKILLVQKLIKNFPREGDTGNNHNCPSQLFMDYVKEKLYSTLVTSEYSLNTRIRDSAATVSEGMEGDIN